MRDLIEKLNPAFDNRNRLAMMALLASNDWVEYNTLKGLLGLTDGNLASHIRALEHSNYLQIRKEFVGRKTRTTYSATEAGKTAFSQHLNTLEQLIQIGRED
jgi:DNA-binding MarR family transcriptional regulator